MAARGLLLAVLFGAGMVLGGCMQSTIEPTTNMSARDKRLLEFAPYEKANIPEQFQRQTVQYQGKESPGTIVINSDARYLYYVLPEGKAIRYGVTVGAEALAWSGVAKIARMTRMADLNSDPGDQEASRCADLRCFGARKIRWARAPCTSSKATRTRSTASTAPRAWTIGTSVSSGCIRMINQDVIDLYDRVEVGARGSGAAVEQQQLVIQSAGGVGPQSLVNGSW